ncbi:hypothetical protein BC826DRAFT_158946 [Russula brevipes]|nr:hypothetical protein BC826DRAFT_158946 [Russula brevipes]
MRGLEPRCYGMEDPLKCGESPQSGGRVSLIADGDFVGDETWNDAGIADAAVQTMENLHPFRSPSLRTVAHSRRGSTAERDDVRPPGAPHGKALIEGRPRSLGSGQPDLGCSGRSAHLRSQTGGLRRRTIRVERSKIMRSRGPPFQLAPAPSILSSSCSLLHRLADLETINYVQGTGGDGGM